MKHPHQGSVSEPIPHWVPAADQPSVTDLRALCSYRHAALILDVSLNHFRGLVADGVVEVVSVGKRAKRARLASVYKVARDGI